MQRHTITIAALSALLMLSGSPAWAQPGGIPAYEPAPIMTDTAEEHIYMPGDMDIPASDGWQMVEPIYEI